jgi:hypothetical protein
MSHLNRIWEFLLLPDEVLVIRRIVNIEPEHIDRHVLLIEAFLDVPNIFRRNIVPSTLVVRNRPERWERCCASQSGISLEDIVGRWARDEEYVHHTRFRDPMGLGATRCRMQDVDECLTSNSVEDSHGGICRMGMQDWDRPIERDSAIGTILEDIRIPKPVRIGVVCFRTFCFWKIKW